MMTKACIMDEAGDPLPEGFDAEKYMRALFQMQPGPMTEVILRCSNDMMIEIVDKFGEDFDSWKSTADSFYVKADVCLSKAFYAWIFQLFAKPGQKILDTHLGSGSSRIAAYDAGLDFVGYEIDKTYFDKQEARFKNHAQQINLFSMQAEPEAVQQSFIF